MSDKVRWCEITVLLPHGDSDKPYGWDGSVYDRLGDQIEELATKVSSEASVGGRFFLMDSDANEVGQAE